MPTGFRLAGASRARAPTYRPNTCFGRIAPYEETSASYQFGVGLVNERRTVYASIFRIVTPS